MALPVSLEDQSAEHPVRVEVSGNPGRSAQGRVVTVDWGPECRQGRCEQDRGERFRPTGDRVVPVTGDR